VILDSQRRAPKPARLVSLGPRGDLKWTNDDLMDGSGWYFEVDPMPDGNLLVSSRRSRDAAVFDIDPNTRYRVW
jgi:hypothetical protein